EKLVEKGILTSTEAQIILDETKQETAKVKAKTGNMDVLWKDGLRLRTDDKKIDLKIGGRIMADTAWMKEDSGLNKEFGKLEDNSEFRRARLYMAGTFLDHLIFKAQYDFAGGDADFKDVYLGYKGIPYLGTVKVGHFKEPFSLNELTSSKYITFMERALPNAFVPGRNIGIALNNSLLGSSKAPRMTWALGVFRDADSFGNASSNEWNITGRITGLPWYEDGGKKLLHLGAAYSWRAPHKTVRYRERPESHMVARFVDTGSFPAKNLSLVGLEGALVYGPFHAEGELIQSFVNRTNGVNNFYSGYVQAGFFLTGEHRSYKNKAGVFSRTKPKNNFNIVKLIDGDYKSIGAWELAARWSGIDLNNHDIEGGIMNDTTAGLNWYLNPNMRIMSNYIHSNRNGIGYADIYQMRFQVDF
ncbi:MAG: porin, partial [Candidatus Auribacterota bacterium]|nr:porin [Candidatus Auribacterota bacterium]